MSVVSIKAPALFRTLLRHRRRPKPCGQSKRPPPSVRAGMRLSAGEKAYPARKRPPPSVRAGMRLSAGEKAYPARNYERRANERAGLEAGRPRRSLTQKSEKQSDRRGTTEARQRARREYAEADKARRTKRPKKTKTALLYNRVYVTARGLAAASPRSVRRCGINGDYTTAPRPIIFSTARRPSEASSRAEAAFLPPTWIFGRSRAFGADKTARAFCFRRASAFLRFGRMMAASVRGGTLSPPFPRRTAKLLRFGFSRRLCGRVSARCPAATLGRRVRSPRPVLSVNHSVIFCLSWLRLLPAPLARFASPRAE